MIFFSLYPSENYLDLNWDTFLYNFLDPDYYEMYMYEEMFPADLFPPEEPPANESGSNNSAAGSKVICKELYIQGLMSEKIFVADEKFGEFIKNNYPVVLNGYLLWANKVVYFMRISRNFTKVVNLIAKPWSEEMAYKMDALSKGNILGKILMFIGIPICGIVGVVAMNINTIVLCFLLICLTVLFVINKRELLFTIRQKKESCQ